MTVCKYYCDYCEEEIPSSKKRVIEVIESINFHTKIMLCDNCWYKKIKPLVMNNFKQDKKDKE